MRVEDLKPVAYFAGYVPVLNGVIVNDDGTVEGGEFAGKKVPDHRCLEIKWFGKSWAVCDACFVLDKNELEMVCQPQPSSREEGFLRDTRFETLEEAVETLNKYKQYQREKQIAYNDQNKSSS